MKSEKETYWYEEWNIEKFLEEAKKTYNIQINGIEKMYLEERLETAIETLEEMKEDTEDLEIMKGKLIKQYYDLLKKIKETKYLRRKRL